MKLNAVWFNPIDRALIPTDLKKLDRAPRRLMEVLLKGSTSSQEKSALKHWHLDFCLSPNEFRSTSGTTSSSHQREPTWVSSTSFRKTRLSDVFDPLAVANLTDSEVTLPSSTVFRSIGYKSTTLAGFRGLGIPHDEQSGVISNDGMGRVIRDVRTTGGAMAREPFPGLYCSGWVKTGPTGVIVSTMADAFATADAIADDWKARRPFLDSSDAKSIPEGWAGLSRQLGNPRVVLWNDWLSIDKAEKERGQMYGKEREKFTSVQDMLKSID
jgi:adrenodoxin-NADP+ reductase